MSADLLMVTNSVSQLTQPGETVETGVLGLENSDFVQSVFFQTPAGSMPAVCSRAGDPTSKGEWKALDATIATRSLSQWANNYVSCSSFFPSATGEFRVRKSNFAACHFLMLDDLGTKVSLDRFAGFEFSWLIETSPGNYQGGIIFDVPVKDQAVAEGLLSLLIKEGLCDPGATGPLTRWARLPVAINGKPKYKKADGENFQCRLIEWRPDVRYAANEIAIRLGLSSLGIDVSSRKRLPSTGNDVDDVLTPKADHNPVIAALKQKKLYKTPLGSGKHDITCPWVLEHTDAIDSGSAYFEPDDQYPLGGFCCQHSHRDMYKIGALIKFLGVDNDEARHQSMIRVVAGDLARVVDAAERELANRDKHFQCGGMIVSIVTNPNSGNSSINPVSMQALTRELSIAASWSRYDARSREWIRCDPPSRAVSILFDAQSFRYLKPLSGLTRNPYFRECDGELVAEAGYDESSQLFGVFVAQNYVIPEPTPEAAELAMKRLEALLEEFHFADKKDKAAALAAIFTAVTRQSYAFAPGFHVKAPVFGSGKSYLCDLISAFASSAGSAKVSYPTTSEEATKVVLSLLMNSPAVIEFDDMDTDWIPHGIIKRAFTADHVTDRVLGVSKTATVSTRILFLGSGNNVGPVKDLLRRVVTININPRCAAPATIKYEGSPVDLVRRKRAEFVSCVLTVIQAWRNAGKPRNNVQNIVTFDGAWSDYCRHPLIWLGYPDPASALFEQIRQDPDADALHSLMTAWAEAFGSKPITVRKAIEIANGGMQNLQDAILDLPVIDKGVVNHIKLGRYLLRNCNRIVAGSEFHKSEAEGRTAWRVLKVPAPPFTGSPGLSMAVA